ncbi:MAG: DUF4870 domain-containing protein [Anaerolineales bacterium]|nr:DUF4870 domain-containing protein [Anaerolineales bacterium]
MNNTPTTEDRIWSAIAHLSALTMGVGLVLPIVGWSSYRRKSNYVAFQSLQALGYQSLGYTIWILVALVIVVVQSLSTLSKMVAAANNGADFGSLTAMGMGGHFAVMFGLMGLYFALPIIAAITCALGKDFRYPLMGNKLARYLGYDTITSNEEQTWLIEDHEDRWVAAMGHFSVIIIFWGMLTPVIAWMMQGKRSWFLKFQAVQAFVFQAGTLLLYFGAGIICFGGALFFLASIGTSGALDFESPAVMTSMIVFLVSMLCASVVMLIVPLLHIMGQWAGYRVLKGDEYRYPWIGRLLEKRLAKQ